MKKYGNVRTVTLITGEIATGKTILSNILRHAFEEGAGEPALVFDDPRKGDTRRYIESAVKHFRAAHLIFTCAWRDAEAFQEVETFLVKYPKVPVTRIKLEPTTGGGGWPSFSHVLNGKAKR